MKKTLLRLISAAAAAALAAAVALIGVMTPSPAVSDAPQTAARASTIAVSKATLVPEARFKVVGVVPARSSRKVVLQRASGTAWRKVSGSSTSRKGKFIFKVEASATPGKYRFRVTAPKSRAGGTRMPAVKTKTVTVTVIDPLGSRTNPYRRGQAMRIGDWTVTINSTDYDSYPESNQDITDPPEPGWTYVSNSTTYTFHGDGGSTPGMDLMTDFLAVNNRVYDAYSGGNVCGNAEPDADDLDDMYAGATVAVHDCVSVPTPLAHDGFWRVEAFLGDRDFFVRAN